MGQRGEFRGEYRLGVTAGEFKEVFHSSQGHRNPKLSGQQLFLRKKIPDDMREIVFRDKPRKRMFASEDLPKNAYSMFLSYNTIQYKRVDVEGWGV